MNKLLSTTINKQQLDIILLMLRVGVGAFMLTHGMGKFENLFSGEEIKFGDPIGLGTTTSLALTVFAEFFCAMAVALR